MNCPLCGSANQNRAARVPVRETERPPDFIYYVLCECGLIFQEERYIPVDYYRGEYRKRLANENVTDKDIYNEYARAFSVYKYFLKHGVKPEWCLDVGSSTGTLLRMLEKEFCCHVMGVEPSDKFREHANQRGTLTVDSLHKTGVKYDLITCVHVLEHQYEPLKFLAEIREKMSNLLFIEVPFRSLNLPHPIVFDLDILGRMMKAAGLKIISLDKEAHLRALCGRA